MSAPIKPNHYPTVPESWTDDKDHRRKLAQAINGLLQGQGNNLDQVTLAANATETVLTHDRITERTVFQLMPRTASAAAAQAGIYVTTTKGSATLHHDSSPATDRTFGLVFFN